MSFPSFTRVDDPATEAFSEPLSGFIKNPTSWQHAHMPVILSRCEFVREQFQPSFFEALGVRFVPSIRSAVPKRQAEFLVGRYLSQSAMAMFEYRVSTGGFELPVGEHRCPIWPSDLMGSISHSESEAFSVVMKKPLAQRCFLGIDVEGIVTEDNAECLREYVVRMEDRQYLKTVDLADNVLLTLVFSAKEALFKATYQYIGAYFGFERARVVFIDAEKQCVGLAFTPEFQLETGISDTFVCHYDWQDNHICSLILQ
ncbi:4'-phosphopantetheinyl transferase [Vibrio anguillarum]|uniref:4'-phosphopantetheinyl transferase family protein n=1 Tax=Vibrio anguillarum TaxID=55601 RepID=UPI003593355F